MIPSPSFYSHYRPISIFNAVGKILFSVFRLQISDHVFWHGLLSDYQSAIRPRHSALKTVVGVLDDVRETTEHKLLSHVDILHLARAYDSARHFQLVSYVRPLGYVLSEVR
jgi:hypothetical protein